MLVHEYSAVFLKVAVVSQLFTEFLFLRLHSFLYLNLFRAADLFGFSRSAFLLFRRCPALFLRCRCRLRRLNFFLWSLRGWGLFLEPLGSRPTYGQLCQLGLFLVLEVGETVQQLNDSSTF